MAGIGQADNALVNVPQMPLVTPAQPVSTDAVSAMVDAFRKGQLTSEDLVSHFGLAAREKTQADTSAAQLANLTAQAQMPLVEPQAALQAAKIGAETATTNWGQNSLKTAQETMGWFGDDISNYTTPDGRTDFAKLAKVGAQRAAQLAQVDSWANMLKPVSERVVKLPDGSERTQYLNALKEDVTPPSEGVDGSPQYWHYVTQLSQYMPKAHPLTHIYPMKYDPSLEPWKPSVTSDQSMVAPHPDVNQLATPYVQPAMTPGGAPQPMPESAQLSQMRAALVKPDASNARDVANMTPEQVVAATPLANVVAAAAGGSPATAAPVITPGAPAMAGMPVVQPPAMRGVQTKYPEQTVFTAEKIRTDLLKEEPYKNWQETVPYATTFRTAADTVRSLTPAQQKSTNMNVVDLGLAESLIKMYDPAGTIREFKWDKFEKNQPLLDRLKNAKSEIMRNGTFTPETRAELVRMGDEVVQGREEAARPYIEKAVAQARSNPALADKLPTIFTSEDIRVAQQSAKKASPHGGVSATVTGTVPPGAKVGTIPGLGRGWLGPDNRWHPLP